jgi:hypothetical protein
VESREIPSKKIHLKTYKKSSLLKTSTWRTFPRFDCNTPKRKGCPRDSRAAKKFQQKLSTGRGQKENDCKAKPNLQGRKKEECFSEERNDGLPIVTTAEEKQKLLQAPLSRTKDALRRSEFPRSAARVSLLPRNKHVATLSQT